MNRESVRRIAFGMSLLFLGPQALACPECQYQSCFLGACACVPTSGCILKSIPAPVRPPDPGRLTERMKHDPIGAAINPMGTYNPTGIPMPEDVAEFAIKNPDQVIGLIQNPGRVLYTPVAAAMIAGRNAVVANGGRPVPENIKVFLRHWYSPELIGSVRWTSDWGTLQNTFQAAQMQFNEDTNALTLINAIVFRDDQAASEPALWAHEMRHVEQYRNWGVTEFARRWVDNSSTGGPVERPAYEREAEADRILASSDDTEDGSPTPPVLSGRPAGRSSTGIAGGPAPTPSGFPAGWQLGQCGCWGFVNLNTVAPAPMCLSGRMVPQMCGPFGQCMGGGAPWVNTCQ